MYYIYSDGSVVFKKYLPHPGYYVFQIGANYARFLKPSNYYVIARTGREAKRIFSEELSWLDCVASVERVEQDKGNKILENPMAYIVI